MAERADPVFYNKVIDGTAMKRLISRLIDHFRMAYTSHILDQVKTLGFQQATATSISSFWMVNISQNMECESNPCLN